MSDEMYRLNAKMEIQKTTALFQVFFSENVLIVPLFDNVILLNQHLIDRNEFTKFTALLQLIIIALYKKNRYGNSQKKKSRIMSTYKQRTLHVARKISVLPVGLAITI